MQQAIWKLLTVFMFVWLLALTVHVTMRETGDAQSRAVIGESLKGWRRDDEILITLHDPEFQHALGAGFRVRKDQLATMIVGAPPCVAELRVEPTSESGSRLMLANGKAKIVAGFESGSPVITGYGPDGQEVWREPKR